MSGQVKEILFPEIEDLLDETPDDYGSEYDAWLAQQPPLLPSNQQPF